LHVTRKSERLEIMHRINDHSDEQKETTYVPLVDIDRIVIIGQPSVSIPALTAVMDRGIPCYFVTHNGRWRGALSSDKNLNGARRIHQYKQSANPDFNLSISRALIHAKILNGKRVIQRLATNRNKTGQDEYEQTMKMLGHYANSTQRTKTIQTTRGLEGIAAALYLENLKQYFPITLPFTKRTRRPPLDPANAILSFGYTVLMSEVEGAIRAHGLDAAIGCLHTNRSHAPALALDLMEPFRPAIDLLILNLVNHNMIKADDHFQKGNDNGIYLNESGRHAFFSEYEKTFTRPYQHPKRKCQTNLRQGIDEHVCAYIRTLEQNINPTFFQLI